MLFYEQLLIYNVNGHKYILFYYFTLYFVSTGKFIAICEAVIHNSSTNNSNYPHLINLTMKENITMKAYENLLQSEIITESSGWICKECMDNALDIPKKKKQKIDDDDQSTEESTAGNEKEIVELIELGKRMSGIVDEDSRKLYLSKNIQNLTELVDFENINWLCERPMKLIHFLSTMCKVDLNTASESKLRAFSKIIELIYFCHNSKLVLPQHFTDNLIQYSLTNSKTCTNYQGSSSPSGSYFILSTWLNKQARDPLPFPKGLTINVFDNNQKVGKTYFIIGDNEVPTRVMTSSLWLILNSAEETQQMNAILQEIGWEKK